MANLLLFLILGMQSRPTQAGNDVVAQNNAQCTCDSKIHDEFEQPLSFNFGPFKGECVDACKFRGVRFLSETDGTRFGADQNHVVIANVLHQHKYWIARVPVNKSTEIDADLEKFLSNISHSVLRFRFAKNDPVLLYRQDGDWRGRKPRSTAKIYDLVLSAEAVPPKNHPFNFFESSFGKYLLAYRVLSIQETITWMIDEKHHSVKQFRLTLDAPTRQRILRAVLAESSAKTFQTAYNLITNNCATSIMNVVDREVDYQRSWKDWLELVQWQRAIPLDSYFGTLYALGTMHLLAPNSQEPNLEQEAGRTF